MSMTATETDLGLDRWVVMPATWETYLRLASERGEKARPRYTFLDGTLTAVSPGVPHEIYKARLRGLLEDLFISLRIKFRPTGSVTLLKTRDSREGTEADESYYLTNRTALAGKTRLIMGEDPPPDLVIEVVVSHPEDDAIEAYRRFGVPEVWVVRTSGLEFLVRDAEGRYAGSPTSGAIPSLTTEAISAWLFRSDVDDETSLRLEFREWVERELAPLIHPPQRPEPADDPQD